MAVFTKSHPENAPGPLFVDTTCIDCGTCYHLGPEIFKEHGDEKSIVVKQPEGKDEWQQAKQALLSCPTNSIGVKGGPEGFKSAGTGLPLLIHENVYYLGYTSKDSFGASAYLIKHPEGNIMIDSPRFHPWLVKELEELGGVKWMFLTHQDDVADHEKFHEHFKCERIIHKYEVSDDTKNCEMIIEGESDFMLTKELKVLMVPGHTQGHMCLLYKDEFLFTGDHLFVNDGEKLRASKSVNWYSWPVQVESLKKLVEEKYSWVLPGHGGWGHFQDGEAQRKLKDYVGLVQV